MRVAVLGPSGLIGSAVMTGLRRCGHGAVGIGHGAADISVDLGDPAKVQAGWFAGCDVLVHCAGVTDEEVKADLGAAARRAMAGTEALIRRAKEAGVRRFVYVSSAHVYGPLVGDIDETRPVNPISDYALLHFAAEQVLRRNAGDDGSSGLLLRPCAVFGPLPDPARFRRWSLVPFSFPRDAATLHEIRLASAGTQRRNFISSDAIASAIIEWLEKPIGGVTLANVLGVDDLSVFALAERSAAIFQRLTGETCAVIRPATTGDDTVPLNYRSRVEPRRAGLGLDQHLENIMNAYRVTGVSR